MYLGFSVYTWKVPLTELFSDKVINLESASQPNPHISCPVFYSFFLLQNCRSTEKNAIATCFSMECASYNINRPIRYCSQCNNIRHNNRRGTDHIVHTTIGSPWVMEPQMQNFTIEAIVRYVISPSCPLGMVL